MFAVIYEDTYMQEGYDAGDPSYPVAYEKLEKFKTKDDLIKWIERNNSSTYGRKKFEVIEYKTVKVTQKIEISVE